MIVELFTALSNMLEQSPLIAVLASFGWGLASVLLSPCHLASVPLVMGFVGDTSDGDRKKAFLLSAVFSFAILLVMVLLGIITAMLGRLMGDIGPWSNWLGALLFTLVGLLLMGILHMPSFALKNHDTYRDGGYKAALLLGLLFGTILGPCAFAFLMPVLGVVFVEASASPLFAFNMIFAYAVGHSIIILIAGTASAWLVDFAHSGKRAIMLRWVRKILGVLCVGTGVWFLFK